jgi:hypothetical protein
MRHPTRAAPSQDEETTMPRIWSQTTGTSRILAAALLACGAAGCTFNFEVTSQRTALENQVMGAYQELEDDLVLISAVRAGEAKRNTASIPPTKRRALDARANQDFNRDDIVELKELQVLGEAADGRVTLLPGGILKSDDKTALRLAQELVGEENGDREVIWTRIIAGNENLSAKDLPAVRKTYARLMRDQAATGHWYQDEDGKWRRKEG